MNPPPPPGDAHGASPSSSTFPWPEDKENGNHVAFVQRLWQRYTYSYMGRLLWRKSHAQSQQNRASDTDNVNTHHHHRIRKPPFITHDDLYQVPKAMRSDVLRRRFWRIYKQYQQQSTSSSGTIQQNKAALFYTLWTLAWPMFGPAGVYQALAVVAQIGVPLLVRELLRQIQQQEEQQNDEEDVSWLPAVGILVLLVIYGICQHKQRHLALQAGATVRAALLTVLYQQVLVMHNHNHNNSSAWTVGQVNTLIAVDTHKVYEVVQEGHLIWALPLAIVLVSASLWTIWGPVTLTGLAVLVALVPLVQRITTVMHTLRTQRVAVTDQRIECTNAFLQGIRVAKVNHYEPAYHAKIMALRQQEVQWLQKETAVWATTLSVSKLSASLAAAATFTVYVLMDVQHHILTAAPSFAVFLLLAALRFPINYAGRFMGRLAQAQSSLQRLALFLEQDTRPWPEDHDDNEKEPLEATNPSSGSSNAVRQPSLTIRQGSFAVGGGGGIASGSFSYLSQLALEEEASHSKNSSTKDDNHANDPPVQQTMTLRPLSHQRSSFVVRGLDVSVHRGEVVACCGPVGSGKSTFLKGIMGDALPALTETQVDIQGNLAVVPQTPFILNATLRDNILFGRPYDPELYRRVVEACCLEPDIVNLGPAADLTEIGERGVTLSGGQKQRISLARAVYGKPDVCLLDDPLSALDAATATAVFRSLIKGPDAFLQSAATILVTHASHFLNQVDRIVVIADGESKFLGTWDELLALEPSDAGTSNAIEYIRQSIQEDAAEANADKQVKENSSGFKDAHTAETLMTKEERDHGTSALSTWLLWFKYAGGVPFMGILTILLAIDRLFYFGQEYWVARWTEGAEESISFLGIHFAPQTAGVEAQHKYLAAYAVLLATALIANLARSEWAVAGGSRAAKSVFAKMLTRVLAAPLSFFETTPMGRLLNRFTYDVEVVDFALSQNMSLLLVASSSYVSGILVMAIILPWIALAVVPITIIYVWLLWKYRQTGTDLQRLDALARSPIQSFVTQGLDGASTIRILKKESYFLAKYTTAVDTSTASLLNFVSAQRWLGCRIEMMAAITVFVPAILVSTLNEYLQLSSGLVGLLIVGSLNFTLALSFLVDFFADAESAITAIERLDIMTKVPQEKPNNTDPSIDLDPHWPASGELEFQEVCMRYRPELPLALKGLSFEIPAGKLCGVVGRTGAGKSSLTTALFRLVEIESGRILLDGVDLGTLGLKDVRGRSHGMTIIPQDPFLSGSCVRECLDPFDESQDEDIVSALMAVGLLQKQPEKAKSTSMFGLNTPIQEGGSNLSVGERQLLNLARALLSHPKLLVLDEASSNVDGATDALIQHMLRTQFPGTTLLIIAHRLQTVMDADVVLVMQDGAAAEFGPPHVLLENGGDSKKGGLFAHLVDATGPGSAAALRAMAQTNKPRNTDCETP